MPGTQPERFKPIIEQIRFWKSQEKENALFIRTFLSALAPHFIKLMQQWEDHFTQTGERAGELMHRLHANAESELSTLRPDSQELANYIFRVHRQSGEWIKQLTQLTKDSDTIRSFPTARLFVMHIARESEYFMRGLNELYRQWAAEQTDLTSEEAVITNAEIFDEDVEIVEDTDENVENAEIVEDPIEILDTSMGSDLAPSDDSLEAGGEYTDGLRIASAGNMDGFRVTAVEKMDEASVNEAANPGEMKHETYSSHNPTRIGHLHAKPIILTKDEFGRWQMADQVEQAEQEHAEPKLGANFIPEADQPRSLPFTNDALMPYFTAQFVQAHYYQLGQQIITQQKRAADWQQRALSLKQPSEIQASTIRIDQLSRLQRLHELYWYNITPHSHTEPSGVLAKQMHQDFGQMGQFYEALHRLVNQHAGKGWICLDWHPASHRLRLQYTNHMDVSQPLRSIPLLALDLEQQTYQLHAESSNIPYVQAWWSLIDWRLVEKRFLYARRLQQPPH